ncbi:MAG TPA: hypothetical protein H9770_07625 [Candidatus Fournierella excrementigallinarum]|nr:hypothetical protein [Candidatus Fournierella excrementigallinarum]
MKKNPLRAAAGGVCALAMMALLFARPFACIEGIRAGLTSCTEQVIPALFPFFVASSIIAASPLAKVLGAAVWPCTRFGLGIRDSRAATALLLAWLGGFAVAARVIGQMYAAGAVTRRQAQLLLVCGVGSGPAFVVNTVGCLLLGSPRLGWCIFAALLLADLAAGLLARLALAPEPEAIKNPLPCREGAVQGIGLVPAVQGAVQSMLAVCGFVTFFSFLNCGLGSFLPASGPARAALAALLEVTGGCVQASRLGGAAAVYGCCAALSIQSLSVFLQVRALLGRDISLLPLAAARPVHLALSLGALRLLLSLVPGAAAAAAAGDRLIVQSRTAPDAALVLFALCCAALYGLGFTSGGQKSIMDENDKGRRRRVS